MLEEDHAHDDALDSHNNDPEVPCQRVGGIMEMECLRLSVCKFTLPLKEYTSFEILHCRTFGDVYTCENQIYEDQATDENGHFTAAIK